MKIKILSILFLVALIAVNSALALDSTVTRSFSDSTPEQCSELTISLTVDINEGETYYAIDEHVPSGWVISDPGTGDTSQPGHIKWVILMSAVDTIYTYNVTVPCDALGIYSFGGIYMFENDTSEQTILGETDVDVQQLIQAFDISLYSGWNLISLPLQPVNSSVEYVIKDLTGQIVVWYYNASNDEWTVYDTNAPFPWLNTLHNMDYGKAYWLKSSLGQTLTIQGTLVTDYVIGLKPGWNFVGYNMSTGIMPSPISGLTTPIVAWAYHTAEDEWEVYDTEAPFPWLNTLTNMTAGKGYWIKSSIEQDWKI